MCVFLAAYGGLRVEVGILKPVFYRCWFEVYRLVEGHKYIQI